MGTEKDDDLEVLLNLGLTNNQARVYLALLKIGVPTKAVDVFKFSGIARQDVYRVLFELQQLGIVDRVVAKPIRFCAAEPKITASILLEKKKSYFRELDHAAKIFTQNYKSQLISHYTQEEAQMELVTKKLSITRRIQKSIEKTQSTVDSITSSTELIRCLPLLRESLNIAKNKGVTIRWVTEKTNKKEAEKIFNILIKNFHVNIKFIIKPPIAAFQIFDENEIILVCGEGKFAEAPVLCTNNSTIIMLAKKYFDTCWKNGERQTVTT